MPMLALKRQVDLHQFPSYKRTEDGAATSGSKRKQRHKGGSGQQGQSQSAGQAEGSFSGKKPFRGGNRGVGKRGRGRGKGQSSQRDAPSDNA